MSASAAEPCTTCRRSSWILPRRNPTKSALVSRAITTASGRIRRRISVVNVPTPGPYSRNTRARAQSTSFKTLLTRKRELGIRLPSIFGCLMKLRPKSRICSEREAVCADTVGDLPFTIGLAPQPAGRRAIAGAGWWRVEKLPKLLVGCAGVPAGARRAGPLHVAFLDRRIDIDRGVSRDDGGILGGASSYRRVCGLNPASVAGVAVLASSQTH